MCAVLWLTIRQYGEFFLFPHYIPLNLFSKFNENDKLLSECGICPSYIRRIMARSSHTPDTAGTGNDGRQIICNIPRIIIARRKIFPYLCRAPLGRTILILRSTRSCKNRQFQDNRQWYKHLLYGGLFVRVYLGVWRCLSIPCLFGRLAMPVYSGQAAHFFIIDSPLSGCKGENNTKILLVPRFGTMPHLLCNTNQ